MNLNILVRFSMWITDFFFLTGTLARDSYLEENY